MINDLRDVDLENISLAVLLTCNTGNYFNPDNIATEDPANIIEQMVICGAETVIGFSGDTYISDCNKFAIALSYQLIIEGDSVFETINNIDYYNYDCDGNFLDLIVIAGNQNNTLR